MKKKQKTEITRHGDASSLLTRRENIPQSNTPHFLVLCHCSGPSGGPEAVDPVPEAILNAARNEMPAIKTFSGSSAAAVASKTS